MALTKVTAAVLNDDAVSVNNIADGAIETAKITDGAIETAKIADNAITESKIATDAVATSKILDDAITSAKIVANAVTHDKLSGAYTVAQTITATNGTINLDASSYTIFRLTSSLTGSTTLNIQNMKEGQVIDILVSGSQTITFSSDDTTETFNKVGSTDYDGAENNHIQVVCIEDLDSGAIYNYTIGTYTSDTTP